MDYLADMIHELRVMAERARSPMLASLLDLAYREARAEMNRRAGS